MIIPQRKWFYTAGGQRHELRLPFRFLTVVAGPSGDGVVEDDFGTTAHPRRALATDRRFVSINDDRGHAGRAA